MIISLLLLTLIIQTIIVISFRLFEIPLYYYYHYSDYMEVSYNRGYQIINFYERNHPAIGDHVDPFSPIDQVFDSRELMRHARRAALL